MVAVVRPSGRGRLRAVAGHLSPALCTLALSVAAESSAAAVRYPAARWAQETPASARVSADGLAEFVRQIESKYGVSSGVVTRDGAQIYAWGNYTERTRWASASKPIFASLMLAAIADGKLASVRLSLSPPHLTRNGAS